MYFTKVQGLVPAAVAAVMASQCPLLNNGPHTEFIYLEAEDNHSCQSQSMVPIKQFNFFCNGTTLLLGSTPSITSGTLYGSQSVI